MANSFPGSGLAYADQFSVGTSGTQAASLYVCSSCVRSAVIENNYAQTNLHHNTLWLRQNNSSGCNYASIGFTIINNGGDHHRVNIAAIANDATAGGNLALYTRNNNGNDTLGLYINHAGNTGIGTCVPGYKLDIGGSGPSFGMSNTSATGYNEMYFSRNTSTVVGYIGVGVNAAVTANGDDFVIQNRLSTGNLVLHTNTTERMRVTCAGNVGIGTSSPRFLLDVAGGAMSNFYMSCCAATVDGIGPYDYGIIGSGNGAGAILINDIVGARYSVAAGSYNLTFRKSVRNTVGACVYCTVMTFVGTADTNCVPNVSITNSLGIGTASPSYKLHVNGTFYAAGSSQDYKQSICNYNTDSCMFMKLKPVTYQYKEEYCHLGKELKSGTQIGLIAEQVAETYPELAILVNEEDNKVVRNVDYEKLSVILLTEVQKLRREVDDLKHKQ